MMSAGMPFDESRHPRGWHGRFGSGPGVSSNAHAMRGARRPGPAPVKRAHAITPVKLTRPSLGLRAQQGFRPSTQE